MNDEALYRSLLADFKRSHGTDLQKIRTALAAADYRSARRAAHTLKSTANLIGARILGGAALAAEEAIKEGGGIPARDVWETLEREFDAVIAELGPIISDPPPKAYGTGKLDPARAFAFIQKLNSLLASRSSDSLNLRDDIREILGPAGEECEKLIGLIGNFDFKEAAETLSHIREKAERHNVVN
jgi:HPt (histidine-containing phosphotransfer) domain-containing protein